MCPTCKQKQSSAAACPVIRPLLIKWKWNGETSSLII
jgi:hypothetical protein